jgi:polar amino acid transport system substrate-binding protein
MGSSTSRAIVVSAAGVLALTAAAPAFAQDAEPDMLARIKDAGVIRMSTDPAYPPQSELVNGEIVGFDVDVGREIATRLGVDFALETPDWSLVTAGSWGDRWDFSVGSMTITSAREEVLDFTQPYYFTPAQMAALADSGITTLEGLAGKSICMGEATTYLEWMNGTLDFGSETPETQPPEGAIAVTRPTDRDCAQEWGLGRRDFDGWLSSSTTVDAAIADGIPIVKVGEPVFYEPLAAAFDKGIEDNDSLVAAVDQIIGEMHADGTLSELSVKWFGEDLTKRVGADEMTEGDQTAAESMAPEDGGE